MRLIRSVLVGALFVACGGSSVSSTSAIGGVATDASVGAFPPEPPSVSSSACPGYEAPREGESCFNVTPEQTKCEYGHDLDRRCNESFLCNGSAWVHMEEGDSECAGRCPEEREAIVDGAPCTDITAGCSYVEGTCACVPTTTDAGGLDGDAGAGQWRCVPPPTRDTCPAQRPAIGSDCVQEISCDYGACALGRDLVFRCEGGIWIQDDAPECP